MSRIAKAPVAVPAGVEVVLGDRHVTVRGPRGALEFDLHANVEVVRENGELRCRPRGEATNGLALAGTTRAVLSNMVTGVTEGFSRALELVGVGYRAQLQGRTLTLSLGYSHAVSYEAPEGIELEVPSQTQVVVRGIDKQRVGQAAAVIRGFRPPEPYKGKGVRYADEQIVRKEAKKK